MSDFFDEEDEPNFFQRHRALSAVLGVLVLGGIIIGAKKLGHQEEGPRRSQNVTMVNLPPPPPPPPPKIEPPPPPQTPQEQKMIEQAPIDEPEDKPQDDPPPAPDLSTGLQGDGPPDGFGLSGRGGAGSGFGGSGRRGGSKWGWYAGQVQSKIQEAMRNNRRTRNANLRIEVRIWAEQTGRINRAQLSGSTGDPAIDAALRNEVLSGLQLQEPPPKGMPMPIVLRITARRPN
ncbi:MAG: TonB C-terminal domain-containing protein [Chthoniobacteraceae bacterium]